MSKVRTSIVFVSTCLLQACGQDISKTDYFPLHEGLKWKYSVYDDASTDFKSRTFTVENIGNIELQDKYFDMPVHIRRTSDGTDYYILSAEDGIFRIGQKRLHEKELTFDSAERKILPLHKDFASGNSWYVESRTYVLRGSALDTVPEAKEVSFEMEFEIVADNETVKVPAGQFEYCIKVSGNASFDLYVDPKLGYQTINIEQHEWYAPSVGMIKLERIEPQSIGMFKGGTVTFELEQFSD